MVIASTTLGKLIRKGNRAFGLRGLPRLLYSSRRVTLGNKLQFFQLENSAYLQLDPSDYFQCMMFFGLYSPEILRLFRLFIHPGDTVVDAGAHIGYFSMYMATLVGPNGHVYCFEPDERARMRLAASVAANQMDWVEVFPQALSAKTSSIDFMLSPQLGWSTAVLNSHLTGLRRVVVESLALDTMVKEGQVAPDIQFIKVDVEGFEAEVLRGMRRVLAGSRPTVLLEANRLMLKAQGESVGSLMLILEAEGYQTYAVAKRIGRKRTTSEKREDDSKDNSDYGCMLAGLTRISSDRSDFEGDLLCFPKERANVILSSLRRDTPREIEC